jgi:hypothetical protein
MLILAKGRLSTLNGPSRLTAIWKASANSECSACSFTRHRLDLRPRSVNAFKGSNRGPAT